MVVGKVVISPFDLGEVFAPVGSLILFGFNEGVLIKINSKVIVQ
jgi:hypothetical protein